MKKVILLVEDDDNLNKLYKVQLESLGYIVEPAADAGEAIGKWFMEPARYRLVISDCMMPMRSGLELAKALRTLGCEVSILLISASDEAPPREVMDENGVTGFLPKPFLLSTLDAQIKMVMTV